jgi:hypothetical protein
LGQTDGIRPAVFATARPPHEPLLLQEVHQRHDRGPINREGVGDRLLRRSAGRLEDGKHGVLPHSDSKWDEGSVCLPSGRIGDPAQEKGHVPIEHVGQSWLAR